MSFPPELLPHLDYCSILSAEESPSQQGQQTTVLDAGETSSRTRSLYCVWYITQQRYGKLGSPENDSLWGVQTYLAGCCIPYP